MNNFMAELPNGSDATSIYLVRHGETDYNLNQIVQGRHIDCPLNDHGRFQATQLAKRFSDEHFDAIYSSTLCRAIQTVAEVSTPHPEVPVFLRRDLEEMNWGIFEGRPMDAAVRAMYNELNVEWCAGDTTRRVDGGESICDVQERALRVLYEMITRHHGRTLLVVTHGRFLRVLLASVLPRFGLTRMNEIKHANTGINLVVFRDGRFEDRMLNCTAHLSVVPKEILDHNANTSDL